MKKIYTTPTTTTVNIEAEQMIAASGKFNIDAQKTTNDRFSNRRNDIWGHEGLWN